MPRSPLQNLFKHQLLYDEKSPEFLNLDRCILLGLVLCRGEHALKARVLYDILQVEGKSGSISAEVKKFKITFKRLVEVGVYLVVKFYVL